ncbi:metal-dependent transcriptional regulator [Corynebacterium liangguodongii]|uniref:Diphtheria toxin repressor n=1 Tax=Corynebacterium liangguodongii TaxID=2079535 RepID=A0A2S0WEE9_9CORY|nr:metal-dependent transcriptional regulator [Corynebacterium liangguodongii]AWB84155.1 metal-dependent regulator [Corynebacterium liangguodongii]PWC00166.1 metal-dependent transcriptional regulator [Corynebacterium liangguodongii]
MRDLVDTTEMYLRTVYELEEEGIVPLRARIVERLDQSGPTVSQTVARMERDGLLVVEADRSLSLTPLGRKRATAVMRKHRLAERLLTDVLQLDLSKVHEEACRWEHVMSEEVERRVVAILEEPYRSPFGNPIPALDALGVDKRPALEPGERASDLDYSAPVSATVVQISEILQLNMEQFRSLQRAGVTIGGRVQLERDDDGGIVVTPQEGTAAVLRPEVAHALRVLPTA